MSARKLSLRAYLLRQRLQSDPAVITVDIEIQPPFGFADVEKGWIPDIEIVDADWTQLSCQIKGAVAGERILTIDLALSTAYSIRGLSNASEPYPFLRGLTFNFDPRVSERLYIESSSFDRSLGNMRID